MVPVRHLKTFLLVALICGSSQAFEKPSSKESFIHTKYLSLGLGAGSVHFLNQEGVSGDTGFSIQLTAGHAFNRYLSAVFTYRFSNFDFNTPDVLNPSSSISTNASMNQESIQLVLRYPRWFIQPYVAAGVGGYSLTGVNRETTLSFPFDVFIPISVGLKTFLVKNVVSFDAEASYDLILGENQSADTLTLLDIDRFAFDMYHLTGTFTFHIF